jgi:hypothetical protein
MTGSAYDVAIGKFGERRDMQELIEVIPEFKMLKTLFVGS